MTGATGAVAGEEVVMFDAKQIERFWSKVDRRGPDECWPWRARVKHDGYGLVDLEGPDGRRTTTVANRVAWESVRGPIPDGLLVCHTCDNPACCNPAHMFLGTNADNMQDMRIKGRAAWQRPRPGQLALCGAWLTRPSPDATTSAR